MGELSGYPMLSLRTLVQHFLGGVNARGFATDTIYKKKNESCCVCANNDVILNSFDS